MTEAMQSQIKRVKSGGTLLLVMALLVLGGRSAPAAGLYIPPPAGAGVQANAYFGAGVAVDGSYMVVGASQESRFGTHCGVVRVYDSGSGVLLHVLPNPRVEDDWFGSSVSISGTRVVVGAANSIVEGAIAGSAYVYDLSSGTPTVPAFTLNNPSPALYDAFGISVSISGTRVVVGAYGDETGATGAGSAYVYDLSSGTPTVPVVTLHNPDPHVFDSFGQSVSISGVYAAVGAPYDDGGAEDAGSAYVYDLTSGTPTVPVATLHNPDPATGDTFGIAVSISGSRVAVGASGDGAGANSAGSVYVYDLSGEPPTVPVETLHNPDPAVYDNFGYSVAISGTRVVVGIPLDDTGAEDAGGAYVYDLSGGTPTVPVVFLNNPDPAFNDGAWNSVAISGTRVVMGLPFDDAGASDAGSVYVYDISGGTPSVPVLSLRNIGSLPEDYFGSSTAVSGTRMVVGVACDDTGAENAGSAYVYDLSSATPTRPVFVLHNPSPAANENFGSSVAVSGTRVVVGVAYDDTGAENAGSAYVYDLSGATPTLPVATLLNPVPADYDEFGYSVAIDGVRAVVGSPYGEDDDGAVYVYDLSSETPAVPVLTVRNPEPGEWDGFGSAVSISGMRMAVGAPRDDTGAIEAGRVYVYDLSGGMPTTPVASFENPAPDEEDWFGSAVAISGMRVVVGAYGDGTGAMNAGSAFVYDVSGGTPTIPIATLRNPGPGEEEYFGECVAISGARVVVGAYGDGTGAAGAGSAYVYDMSSGMPEVPVQTLNDPGPAAHDNFGSDVSIDETMIVVGAPGDDAQNTDRGAVYVFTPEIVVEQPAASAIADGGSKSFGNVAVNANSDLTFTIRNIGDTDLTGLGITLDGADAAMFSITASPTAPVSGPGGSTTLVVRFTPTGAGAKSAALHIANNDCNENPFDINLAGTGVLTEPTAAPDNPTFSSIGAEQMQVNLAGGDGSGYLVVAGEAALTGTEPADETGYTANSALTGDGTALGNGKVVYVGAGPNFTLTGLRPNRTYHVKAYSFNGSGGTANYKTDAAGSASQVTAKKNLTVSGLTSSGKVYDGTVSATASITSWGSLDAGVVSGDLVTLVTSGGSATFGDRHVANGKTVTAAGLTLGSTDAANYILLQPTTTANITPKTLTVVGLSAKSKVFDGDTTAQLLGTAAFQTAETPGGGTTGDGKPYDGDTVTISGTPAGSFSTAAVGNNKPVTVTGITLAGPNNGNYTVTPPAGLTADIIPGASVVAGTDVNISLDVVSGHEYKLYACATPDGTFDPVDTDTADGGTLTLTDPAGAGTPPRFYKIMDNGSLGSTVSGYYSRPTAVGTWYHLGSPIDYGVCGGLDKLLGADLATGAAPGASEDADLLYVWNPAGVGAWSNYYLNAESKWVDANGQLSDYAPAPYATFWLKRRGTGADERTLTFFGPVKEGAQPAISFPAGKWTQFSWPFSMPRREDTGTPQGWEFAAAGGVQGGSWQNADKLVIGSGTNAVFIYLGSDARWHNLNGSIAPDKVLRAGEGYYYFHRTGAGDMSWTPSEN